MSYDAIVAAAQESARNLGYLGLKELQLKVVVSFVTGNDIFAVLPTGYGKSLCYACLPGTFDLVHHCTPEESSIVVVVTPLTAIIEDQV